MLQKSYRIDNFSDGSLQAMLREVAALPAYRGAAQVLLIVFEHNWDTEVIRRQLDAVREALPKAEVAGITHLDERSPLFWSDISEDPCCADFSFLIFERPAFLLRRCAIRGLSDAEAGAALNRMLRETTDCRGAILLLSEMGRNADMILDKACEGAGDVPVFGGTAGLCVRSWGESAGYVFDAAGVCSDTALLVLFRGESVRVKVTYNYGWTSVGREMTITGMEGDFLVTEIDGRPAMEIYRRYLGLSPSLVLVPNVCEFPLIVERGGLTLARVPSRCERGGKLRFAVAMRKGEKIRFSYGAQREIFSQIYHDAESYLDFSPQAMLLTVCGNRLVFLKGDEHYEVDYYRQLAPQLAVLHGNSELYHSGGAGGELNSALVAIGLREGEPEKQELTLARKSFLADSASTSFLIPLEYRVMFFLSAVTEDLMRMTEQANAANEAKSAFLSNMSHEIRTPINAVLGMNEMILRESREEGTLEYAENIRAAGTSLLELINDILDFSKIEAGKMDILPAEYSTASLLNDLVNMIRLRAENKGLSFSVEADADLPAVLYGDEVRVRQVVTNILTNAVKYTERGGVTMRVYAEPSERAGHVVLCVSVADTGIGIREEDMKKLFSAFERIEESRNRGIEGTGLGMNITQRLLSMMGTRLKVESEYGKGSVFSFRLEQKLVDGTPMGDFSEAFRRSLAGHARYRESFTAPEARVLAVDDTPMNLAVFSGLLKQTKIRVDTARSGMECLELLTKQRYDLVFLDHRMPEMDGVETLRRMKALPENRSADAPVIALTANAVSGAREEYLALGFDDYLAKPIDAAALEKLTRRYLPQDKVIPGAAEEPEADAPAEEPEDGALPAVEGLDWAYAQLHLPTRALLQTGLREFYGALDTQAERLEGFRAALPEEAAWDGYRILVHAMKSAAATVGIVPLAGMAKVLEYAARDRDAETVGGVHPAFLREWLFYRDRLRGVFGLGEEAAAEEDFDAETVRALLTEVRDGMDDFDVDRADGAMERLARIRLPERLREVYTRLKTAVADVDSDAACEAAAELLKEVSG